MHAAVDELYRDHGAAATRFAYLLTGSQARAEDLVQDAFVRLLARVRRVRDPNLLRAYLTKTLVNLAKNSYRSDDRLRRFVTSGRATGPDVAALPDVEVRDELHRHLMELPYRQRAALVLRYCEDRSETEVAEALGTTNKAVRSLVGRGLEAIRTTNGATRDE